jgi:hypothetical protein
MKLNSKSIMVIILVISLTLISVVVGCAGMEAQTPASTPTQVPYQQNVEDFIKNGSTFEFDGIAGSIKFMNIIGSTGETSTTSAKHWEFTVKFQTAHPGHGDRTGQALAQVITDHIAIIKIESAIIISAVCDNTWDMLNDNAYVDATSAQRIAEDFIANDETFKFDGIDGSIRTVKTEPGWSPAFRSIALTIEYQTGHPGHGDRTGMVLAQIITDHTAALLVNIEKGTVAMAVCDKTWDMVNDLNPPASVSGIVISGGDTTPLDGPTGAPRIFVYEVKRDDGTTVKVSYTAYPPSPIGDANRSKITLDISEGSINIGDRMEALGRLDTENNTIVVAGQGDYIRTVRPPA